MRALRPFVVHLLPLPALLVIAIVLIASDDVWVVRTMTRYARPGSTYAELALIATAILLPAWYASPWLSGMLGRSRGVRTPTDAELSVARYLMRALILGGLYLVAYGLTHRFL